MFQWATIGVTWVLQCRRGVSELADRAQYREQIEKIVASHTLHGSESLCKLLNYLTEQALDHPGTSPKEYQIATEVFGRPSDFDPHLDSTVRVQVGRLRTKLAEYYASEGVDDQILVDFPRGTYALTFHERPHGAGRAHGAAWQEPPSWSMRQSQSSRRWFAVVILLSIVLSAVVAVTTDRFLTRLTAEARLGSEKKDTPAPLRIFWKGFLPGPEEPSVIFSNAAFVGRPDTGMRYYDSKRDSSARALDYYTGVGEVLAVHALDRIFEQLHQGIRVKRGSLFSLDDAKNNDLIFIGSPSENLTLLDVPGTQEFVFQRITTGVSQGAMKIVNVHPEQGEVKEFLATPPVEPLVDDYSVIAMKRGLDPAHSVLILAGTTTIGTQGAVEYVCRQNSLQDLLRHLSVTNSAELRPFEAVIRVKVARGVPVAEELVTLRKGTS